MRNPILLCLIPLGACGLFDREPPELHVQPPEGPRTGVVDLGLRASDPSGVRLGVAIDGAAPVAVEPGWALDTSDLEDGEHVVRVEAVDRTPWRNRAEREVRVVVDHTPPELAVHVGPAAQGRTTAIFVATSEDARVHAAIRTVEPPLFPVGERRWRALVGFEIEQPAGTVPLVVTAVDAAGNEARHEASIRIEETAFARGGMIPLTPQLRAQRKDTGTIRRIYAEREAAAKHPIEEQLWSGPMAWPVKGRLTSPFGKFRTYADGERSHHRGTDIAQRAGTPVRAPAAGEVRLAGEQPIYGGTIILHHGQGVATSYAHLSSVDVEVGQAVEAGEIIGRVGSTGQSTGPHLHWGLLVHGVAVAAEQWLETGFELDDELDRALAEALGAPGDG